MAHNRIIKILFTIVLPLLASTMLAETYSSLWKKVETERKQDHPRTMIDLLGKIAAKAELEHSYGNMIKAEVARVMVWNNISPDSVAAPLQVLKDKQRTAVDPVLKAVYSAVLGKYYNSRPAFSVFSEDTFITNGQDLPADSSAIISAAYFDQALADMDVLAHTKTGGYTPIIDQQTDSYIFDDDLLHVIGFEAGRYAQLRNWYETHNNRYAACISAFYQTQKDRFEDTKEMRRSKYLNTLDSLINVYQDLPDAGELAIERFNFMDQATDASAEEKIDYINYALQRWGDWCRMNVLRNAKTRLTLPAFHASVVNSNVLPNTSIKVMLTEVCNINELNMAVYRLNVPTVSDLNPNDADDYKILKKWKAATPQCTDRRTYIGMPDYKTVTDSMTIQPLKPGNYIVEFSTSNRSIATERILLRVTDLMMMAEELPDKHIRMSVVSATTGMPVPEAGIKLYFRYGREQQEEVIKANQMGEVDYVYTHKPYAYKLFLPTDEAAPKEFFSLQYNYSENTIDRIVPKIFTDRTLYRPGQTIKVSTIVYNNHKGKEYSTVENADVTITLFDVNHQKLEERQLKSDEWGVANTEFKLPQKGLTGNVSISVMAQYNKQRWTHWHSVKVEQYKRPTFDVEFEEYADAYEPGDTIAVSGRARTYSGHPVRNAKVVYTVERTQPWFVRYSRAESVVLNTDTVRTDEDGCFEIRMPMIMPEMKKDIGSHFFINATADVTDLAGETHTAQTSLPLSTKSTFLTMQMPDVVLRDSLKTVHFTMLNAAGREIDGDVVYAVDNGNTIQVKANKTVSFDASKLASGRHVLEAMCQGDTIRREFVVFNLNDNKAPIETHDWYYCSANTFPSDGSPIYLQVGSTDRIQHIVYTAVSGGKVLSNATIDLHNEVLTHPLYYNEAHGDGVTISMAWVKDGRIYTHTEQLKKPAPSKQLDMQWATFRDRLTPGQKETWTLKVDPTKGKSHVMALLYDKSLDQISFSKPDLNLFLSVARNMSGCRWNSNFGRFEAVFGEMPFTPLVERTLNLSHFSFGDWTYVDNYRYKFAKPMMLQSAMAVEESAMFDAAETFTNTVQAKARATGVVSNDSAIEEKDEVLEAPVAMGGQPNGVTNERENFNETAFFQTNLVTDENGIAKISFTLPESVTTWRFLALAHDKTMNTGHLESEVVAQKSVMVQPNMPRFIRMGDKASLAVNVSNMTDKIKTGIATLEILDAESMKSVGKQNRQIQLDTNSTQKISFDIPTNLLSGVYVARITAQGRDFSDGEQHYLPVLPATEMVTSTIAFTQNTAGKKTIDVASLFPEGCLQPCLTVEYTNNPAWLMVQTLPYLGSQTNQNAVAISSALYANTIGSFLLQQNAGMKEQIMSWQENAEALSSQLEQNQELKNLVLEETPWVADASGEQRQRSLLRNYFDLPTLNVLAQANIAELRKMQLSDGAFPWCTGMTASPYITGRVLMTLARMKYLAGNDSGADDIFEHALGYMTSYVSKEVARLRELESRHKAEIVPSDQLIDYMYTIALSGHNLSTAAQRDYIYLLGHLKKHPAQLSIYAKSHAAVVLLKSSVGADQAAAKSMLQSVCEYTVASEEMGRYFDTAKAEYSWRNYRIPSQVAAIEALQTIAGFAPDIVSEMQRWLLQQKRTQMWDTTINTTDAVYAFLNLRTDGLLADVQPAVISVDDKRINAAAKPAGIGYVKEMKEGRARKVTFDKKSNGVSWGAVYAQSLQNTASVDNNGDQIKVKREYVDASGRTLQLSELHVGQRVKVRITVTAQRNLDFVQIVDSRGSCLEPVSQMSGYQRGYYCSPQDNRTCYYFDQLNKGTHVIETEYFVDRTGTYNTGLCTAQCAYSPEYSARAASQTIIVKE